MEPISNDSLGIALTAEFNSRYRIVGLLAEGGSAKIYAAEDALLQRKVALKILHMPEGDDETSKTQRFFQEARSTSMLTHPHIVKVFAFGEIGAGQLYIEMELLEGKTLESFLKENRFLNREQFEEIILPVMDALIHAHDQNIIHRDIKPANIMICETDGQTCVKLLDFGISKLVNTDLTLTTSSSNNSHQIGTSYYMSPEQCSAQKIDFRSDIYSLACVMYETLAGKPPFTGETAAETMYSHLKSSVPSLREISAARKISRSLAEVIMDALSKDPAKRPQTMRIFHDRTVSALKSKRYIAKKNQFKKIALSSVLLLIAIALVPLLMPKIAKNTELTTGAMVYKPKAYKFSDFDNAIDNLEQYSSDPQEILIELKAIENKFGKRLNQYDLVRLQTRLGLAFSKLFEKTKNADYKLEAIKNLEKSLAETGERDGNKRAQLVATLCWLHSFDASPSKIIAICRKNVKLAEKYPSATKPYDLACMYLQLANALHREGKDKKATIEAYKKGLSLFDKLPEGRTSLASLIITTSYFYILQESRDSAEYARQKQKLEDDLLSDKPKAESYEEALQRAIDFELQLKNDEMVERLKKRLEQYRRQKLSP